jgi:fructokinase
MGLDVGGTKIEIQVLDADGKRVYQYREPTCKSNYDAFTQQVCQLVQSAEAELKTPCSVGLCLPGSLDFSTGLMKNSNILVLNHQPLQQTLQTLLDRPVSISNDANCFTLSEAVDGAGQGEHTVFGVILGTGCGGGMVINQTLQQGKNGNCGEWGHVPLPYYDPVRDGPSHSCYCGQHNCIESFISGTGIARQLTHHYKKPIDAVTFFTHMLKEDDPLAENFILQLRDQLARCFALIINMIDPDVIVVGGGMSNVKILFQDIHDQIGRYTFGHYDNTPVRVAIHGDSSGIRGAAWLGRSAINTLT